MALPELVRDATDLAHAHAFLLASTPETGAFLAAMAATVPLDGRILELGTGIGIGTGWLVHGLGDRQDVQIRSVDVHAGFVELAASLSWPSYVTLDVQDGHDALRVAQTYDLIFADAPAGKWSALDDTVAALTPTGRLVVDDMTPERFQDTLHERKTSEVREALLGHPDLVVVEIGWSTGLMLCVRRA